MSLLTVSNLSVRDKRTKEFLIKNISFTLDANACLGIVGESGSGKSITSKALLGLTDPWLDVAGTVQFDGVELLTADREALRIIRGKRICMILQDAMTAFDPLCTIGYQIVETLCEHTGASEKEAKLVTLAALEEMDIHEPLAVIKKYPHQLSGGMLQRCMIALALALKPDVIIADEPTTALDSIHQRQVLEQFQKLRQISNTAVIFISHDLGVIQYLAQQVLVMRAGQQVEYGEAGQVLSRPQHPYTRCLVDTRIALTRPFLAAKREVSAVADCERRL